jgi:hypothetical protein
MDAAPSENSNTMADNYELKRLCIIFGVTQSNTLYRILSANDKAEMMERINQETESLKLALRGGEKCEDGKVWDEVRQQCV